MRFTRDATCKTLDLHECCDVCTRVKEIEEEGKKVRKSMNTTCLQPWRWTITESTTSGKKRKKAKIIAELQKKGYDLKDYNEKVVAIEAITSNLFVKQKRERRRGTMRSRKKRNVILDSELHNDNAEAPFQSNTAGFVDDSSHIDDEGDSESSTIGGSLSSSSVATDASSAMANPIFSVVSTDLSAMDSPSCASVQSSICRSDPPDLPALEEYDSDGWNDSDSESVPRCSATQPPSEERLSPPTPEHAQAHCAFNDLPAAANMLLEFRGVSETLEKEKNAD